ncbi:MAG: D-glycero-alpha-D-manno-heptose-1,7-bisphosphate 7-phosphatase [Acidobacteriota bacterium]
MSGLPIQLPPEVHTVFLDRDGVLNEKMPEGQYVTRWEEFRVLPGVPEAVARLNAAGILVVVVSNQRGIAKGLYTASDLEVIHDHFQELLRSRGAHVDGFFACPHDRNECNCRKPLSGLYDQARARFPEIAPATSVMIGDTLGDMEFGRRLGMATLFIEVDRARQRSGAAQARELAAGCFHSLREAVEAMLTASRTAVSPG